MTLKKITGVIKEKLRFYHGKPPLACTVAGVALILLLGAACTFIPSIQQAIPPFFVLVFLLLIGMAAVALLLGELTDTDKRARTGDNIFYKICGSLLVIVVITTIVMGVWVLIKILK